MRLIFPLLFCTPAFGQAPILCAGDSPDWTASIGQATGSLSFRNKDYDYDIPHIAIAEGNTGTKAYSLIGETDTAILILSTDGTAHVLTQDRSLPILLDGLCE